MEDRALISLLSQTDLDEKESRVYLALIELGQATATEIAQKAELKRSIVYHVLERLKERGYAGEIPGKKIRTYISTDPEKLFIKLKSTVDNLKEMLPYIKALQSKGRNRPKFEYFEGKDAIISVFNQMVQAKDARYMSAMGRLQEHFPGEIGYWIKNFQQDAFGQVSKNLFTDTPEDREIGKELEASGQVVKYLPKGVSVEMDFGITDDMLGITSFDPLFIVVIHSEKIARSAAVLFDLAWEKARDAK